jgi:hypothetical protein
MHASVSLRKIGFQKFRTIVNISISDNADEPFVRGFPNGKRARCGWGALPSELDALALCRAHPDSVNITSSRNLGPPSRVHVRGEGKGANERVRFWEWRCNPRRSVLTRITSEDLAIRVTGGLLTKSVSDAPDCVQPVPRNICI